MSGIPSFRFLSYICDTIKPVAKTRKVKELKDLPKAVEAEPIKKVVVETVQPQIVETKAHVTEVITPVVAEVKHPVTETRAVETVSETQTEGKKALAKKASKTAVKKDPAAKKTATKKTPAKKG